MKASFIFGMFIVMVMLLLGMNYLNEEVQTQGQNENATSFQAFVGTIFPFFMPLLFLFFIGVFLAKVFQWG